MSVQYARYDFSNKIPSNPTSGQCPKCHKMVKTICDNSCGTFICKNDGTEFYIMTSETKIAPRVIEAHHPKCGNYE